METIEEIQKMRTQLIQYINVMFDEFIQKNITGNMDMASNSTEHVAAVKEYESIYPLTASTGIFKGLKPTGVRFKDGTRVDVTKWKQVVAVIMKKCNDDSNNHALLMALRGKVSGRDRVLLSESDVNMRSPLEIDEKLYMETHYDTETLLKIMTTRILEPVGFDYSGITIAVRNGN